MCCLLFAIVLFIVVWFVFGLGFGCYVGAAVIALVFLFLLGLFYDLFALRLLLVLFGCFGVHFVRCLFYCLLGVCCFVCFACVAGFGLALYLLVFCDAYVFLFNFVASL